MIDTNTETLLTLADAAVTLPGTAASGGLCRHTLYRWATKGQRGVVLETVCIGRRRYTSTEAVHRFIQQLTEVQDGDGSAIVIACDPQELAKE